MRRRTVVGLLGGWTLTALAGCLDFVRGGQPLTLRAGVVRVADDVLATTEYTFVEVTEVVLDREFERGGRTREVEVTNTQTDYERSIDVGPFGEVDAAVFTAVATPSTASFGREFNPLENITTSDMVEMVQDRYVDLEDVERVDTHVIPIYGRPAWVTEHISTASLDGRDIEIRIFVTRGVEFDDDLIAAIGVFPAILIDEREAVFRLMEGLEPA